MQERPVLLKFGNTLLHFSAISHIEMNQQNKKATIFVIGLATALIKESAEAFTFFSQDNIGWFQTHTLS